MKVKGFLDTIEWYNQNANQYANATLQSASIEQIKQFVDFLPKGAWVLDAGCGSGRDTNLLTKEGLTCVGIDLSNGLIEVAKKTYPNLNFIEGDMLSLPYPNNHFDGLWSHASLLHLETVDDVKKAILEFRRVLKNKGIMHILVKAQTGEKKTAVVSDALSKHDRFFQYFTKQEITNLLEKSGFKLLFTEQYKEIDKQPNGRSDVEWILTLSSKV